MWVQVKDVVGEKRTADVTHVATGDLNGDGVADGALIESLLRGPVRVDITLEPDPSLPKIPKNILWLSRRC